MLIVRVLTAAARPAIVAGALSAAAAGAYFAIERTHGNGGVSAFQQIQGHGQQLLISEFGERADTIVAVDPADVSHRQTIASIDHADGYGVFPALSPDGKAIAYTALPSDLLKPAPDSPAQAAVVDVNGDVRLLANDIDLLVTPVWSPGSRSIAVRKNTPGEDSAGTFELVLLGVDGSRSTITTWSTAAVFPIAFAPDGSKLYFATLDGSGTDLYGIAPDGSGETKIAHLSDQIARDWKLSPDGATLAYTVAESGATPRIVTKRLDLGSGAVSDAVASAAPHSEFNPAWSSDGKLTVASVKLAGGGSAVVAGPAGDARVITASDSSVDLPLAWSPDGAHLAVRSVSGTGPADAGQSHVELVGQDGERARVSDNADVLIVGWLR